MVSEAADPCPKAPKYPEYSAKSCSHRSLCTARHLWDFDLLHLGILDERSCNNLQRQSGIECKLSKEELLLALWGVLVGRNFPNDDESRESRVTLPNYGSIQTLFRVQYSPFVSLFVLLSTVVARLLLFSSVWCFVLELLLLLLLCQPSGLRVVAQ